MTQQQYIINRKLNIVELSQQLGNISEACLRLGVSRQHYYDIKAALQDEGIHGLLEKTRNKPRIGNRVPAAIEDRILSYSLECSTHGQARVSNELKKEGIIVSPGGVRSIWLRHGLEKSALRLNRLEKWAGESGDILTENQVQALEKAKEDKQAHGEIESYHSGGFCLDRTPSKWAGSRESGRFISRQESILTATRVFLSYIQIKPPLQQQTSSMTRCCHFLIHTMSLLSGFLLTVEQNTVGYEKTIPTSCFFILMILNIQRPRPDIPRPMGLLRGSTRRFLMSFIRYSSGRSCILRLNKYRLI